MPLSIPTLPQAAAWASMEVEDWYSIRIPAGLPVNLRPTGPPQQARIHDYGFAVH